VRILNGGLLVVAAQGDPEGILSVKIPKLLKTMGTEGLWRIYKYVFDPLSIMETPLAAIFARAEGRDARCVPYLR